MLRECEEEQVWKELEEKIWTDYSVITQSVLTFNSGISQQQPTIW